MSTNKEHTKKYIFGFLIVLQMALIFAFSAQNADLSTDTSHGFIRLIGEKVFSSLTPEQLNTAVERFDFAVRKAAHFTVYFVLGAFSTLFFNEFSKNPKKISIFYAI